MVSSEVTQTPKKEPPFPAALKLITGRRQTEWTGATRCPNEDSASHRRESLTNRKRTILFSFRLPCRPLAEPQQSSLRKQGPIATDACYGRWWLRLRKTQTLVAMGPGS